MMFGRRGPLRTGVNSKKRSCYFFKKRLMMSIGTGKMMVEFFSVATSAKV